MRNGPTASDATTVVDLPQPSKVPSYQLVGASTSSYFVVAFFFHHVVVPMIQQETLFLAHRLSPPSRLRWIRDDAHQLEI